MTSISQSAYMTNARIKTIEAALNRALLHLQQEQPVDPIAAIADQLLLTQPLEPHSAVPAADDSSDSFHM